MRYQRTAHRITSAVNCRPLNSLPCVMPPAPPPASLRRPVYPIRTRLTNLQQIQRDGPLAFGRPDPAQDRLQPDTVLVGRPDFDRLVRVLGPLLGNNPGQLFLNASRSSGVAEAGWRG